MKPHDPFGPQSFFKLIPFEVSKFLKSFLIGDFRNKYHENIFVFYGKGFLGSLKLRPGCLNLFFTSEPWVSYIGFII